jgi:ADP-heptose:LPS heptosyltransferase
MDSPHAATGRLKTPRRVAILRALALGDLLCAVPVLRAFRRAWPTAKIALVGLPSARELAARFPKYIDSFVEFPGWPGLPERQPLIEQIPPFLSQMQAERFDLAIQLHGSGTIVNSLIELFGARQSAGFYPPGYYCPQPETFVPWPERGLETHRLLTLVDWLGLQRAGDELELPLADDDFKRLRTLLRASVGADQPYIVFHPGASTPLRRWPVEWFAAVATQLAEDGWPILITGVESERTLAEQLAGLVHGQVMNLAGKTNLGTLGALVRRASLVVCNDTGISHVAAAVRTPSVVISTGDNPARWAPIDQRLHRVLCQPCTVEQVFAAVTQQLRVKQSGDFATTRGAMASRQGDELCAVSAS